jgi:hypothetical protein
MSARKLSSEEFRIFIHALMADGNLKIKYQNPMVWRGTIQYNYL